MQADDNRKRFQGLAEDMLRLTWESDPVDATLLGVHEYDHTLGDVSPDVFRGHATRFRDYMEALQSTVDPLKLEADPALDYNLAVSLASTRFVLLECERQWERNPAVYVSRCLWGCLGLLIHDFAPLEDRMRSVLSRMREIPGLLRTAGKTVTDPPAVYVQVGAEMAEGGVSFFRMDIPAMAESVPSLSSDLRSAAEKAASALEEFGNRLSDTLLPMSGGNFAAGYDTYEQLLFGQHYITYSPNDLALLAKGMLSDAQREIREVAASIDPSVPWQELLVRLKADHPAPGEVLPAYRTALREAEEFVRANGLVTLPEEDNLEISPTPEFERSVIPYAAYLPVPPFGRDGTGRFWVTPVEEDGPSEEREKQLREHCTYALPVRAVHEGYPGHHLQLTRARRAGSALRKQTMSSLFTEGWAFYCEQMMHEQGFYTDPRVRLFQLRDAIWRACRVIVDVGLHTTGMSIREAVDLLMTEACMEEPNAVAEVKRYTMSVTQPMTYAIGNLLLLDLKDRMRRKLGNDFDLKAFHDRLLDYGSLPTPLIARAMLRQG